MNDLRLENLSVTLGRRPVLRQISAAVRPGEVVGILGPNGAGKSTLIKAALGLVAVSSGEIWLGETLLDQLRPLARSRHIAYMAQEREVAWSMTVEAVVSLGRLPHRSAFAGDTDADRSAIEAALRDANVVALRERSVLELSGGERARVLMARALAQAAPVLLADEPTSGLDPAHQLSLLKLLREKAGEGRAIALSIHELHLAQRWCDRLILLSDGRIASDGAPEDVLTRENIRAVYGCDAHIASTSQGPVIVPIPA